jgi:hypothetical protein
LLVDDLVKEGWKREGVADDAQFVAAPGLRWLAVGKALDGYWTHDNTIVHTVDMIDVFDVLYGKHAHKYPEWYIGYKCQAMFHFDWSSGHGAFKEGALNPNAISLKWGGAQTPVRDSKIEKVDGYLGPYAAMAGGVDYKLKVGETQSGALTNPERPPFYELTKPAGNGERAQLVVAPPGCKDYAAIEKILAANKEAEASLEASDFNFNSLLKPLVDAFVRVRLAQQPGKRVPPAPKGKKAEVVLEARRLYSEGAHVVLELGEQPDGYESWQSSVAAASADDESGWLNAAKGLKQYLFERGFIHPSGTQTLEGKRGDDDEEYEDDELKKGVHYWEEDLDLGNGTTKKIRVSSSLKEVASNLYDFENEKTQLQQLIEDLGHRMDKTPKCHPEIAGEGVELNWGKSAYEFRHNTNSGEVKNLRKNSILSLRPQVLHLERIRKFERMVWRYKEVYRHHADGGASTMEYKEIERLQRVMKKHRSCDYELHLAEGRVASMSGFLA